MLGVSAPRGNIHGQYTDSSVTVTQQYYDSVIETNGGKSEMVKGTKQGWEMTVMQGPFQPFIAVLLLIVVAHL